jgi:ribA/ribD-fused uncharacterized protein
MSCKFPKDMLKYGRKAKNFSGISNLESEEEKIMRRGVREKFDQNLKLKDFLVSTGPTGKIGESSASNRRWGTGYHLGHKMAFRTDLWATNLLGDILTEQRNLYITQ